MKKIKILMIDSNLKEISRFLSDLLGEWNTIELASNSIEALEKVASDTPDVIISEYKLSGMNGIELCSVLKSNKEFVDIPFILLTSSLTITIKIDCINAGANFCFDKSISSKELEQHIKSVINKKSFILKAKKETPSAFSGSLEQMSIVELIQSIDMTQKTGRLLLEYDKDWGEFFFQTGKIIDAQTENLFGDKAVFRMLGWKVGNFNFYIETEIRKARIYEKPQFLILEGIKRLDEKNRLLKELPDLHQVFMPNLPLAEILQREKLSDTEEAMLMFFRTTNTAEQIIKNNTIGDLEALYALKLFLKKNIIKPQKASKKVNNIKIAIADKTSFSSDTIKTSDGFFGNIEDYFGVADNVSDEIDDE